MVKNYYETLGIAETSSAEEIKKAYRNLARQFHPDVNKDSGAEAKFKEITEAYETLSDDGKRQEYDNRGKPQSGFQGFGFQHPFGDIFSQFVGQQQHRPQRGADIQQIVDLSFEEMLFGATKQIVYSRQTACQPCSGTGSQDKRSTKCQRCAGAGRVIFYRQMGPINFQESTNCPECSGLGTKVEAPCVPCAGSGIVQHQNNINTTIPPGSQTGMNLSIQGMGHACARNLGPSGDLILSISVRNRVNVAAEPSTLSLVTKVKLDVLDALIGTKIEVSVPDYEKNELSLAKLNIPPGTYSGQKFRIAQKGIRHIQDLGKVGDMIVEVEHVVPAITDPAEVEAVKNLIERRR